MTKNALAIGAGLLAAGLAAAQTPPAVAGTVSKTPRSAAAPRPTKSASTKGAKSAKPPLDFSGVWELDMGASRGVGPNMRSAVLSVKQNGNRIWIEPIEQQKATLLAEQIVVDGRKYEKTIGRDRKGTLVAEWGKDGESLWLEATAGTDEKPETATQRMVWRLRENGKVWTRQTWTVQEGDNRETFLVFRKREAKK